MPVHQRDPSLVPGMIEPVECNLLRRLARECLFGEDDCAVEFGAFFGKSTSFIAQGLSENRTYARTFYVYDCFACDRKGSFFPTSFNLRIQGAFVTYYATRVGGSIFSPFLVLI